MHGQGSPNTSNVPLAGPNGRRACSIYQCLQVAVCFCALLGIGLEAAAQDLNLRLWIAWGGGAACRWTGQIRVDGDPQQALGRNAITEFRPVGLTPDEPGSMYVRGNTLHIAPRTPRTYDAVSLSVTSSQNATLTIVLTPDGRQEQTKNIVVPFARLVSEVQHSPLDERGNQLLVRRAIGDGLRIKYARDSLVFAPSQAFNIHVDPHLHPELKDLEPGTTLLYSVELRRARTDDSVWEDEREARTDQNGDPPEVGPLLIQLPGAEGVYDLVVTLKKRRFPTPFAPRQPLCERRLQLVVVDTKSAQPDGAGWQVIHEITPEVDTALAQADSPSKPKIWKALPKLPDWSRKLPDWSQLPWRPGSGKSGKKKPLGNGKSRKQVHATHQFVELLPAGWQAYPLPIAQPGMPHVLELQYPSDHEQTMGISILEPNAAGIVTPVCISSGLDVPATGSTSSPRIERHRILFWPRTGTPLLLLSNHREDVSTAFGQIRVLSGPGTLPARHFPAGEDGRLIGTYLDRPLIAESFSASDTWDPVAKRNLNDWVMFHQGGVRLIQYLKYLGHNSAIISVLHEGSAIYPSRLLGATPKYDNGVFFATGQDPMPKDILEMLFRLFDREGLKLIPALQFSAPLPELETLYRQRAATAGVELIGAAGRSWREMNGAERATGPLYNPLDPQVQQAMHAVIQEMTERYGRHPSFAGVAIQLGPDTYAQLPDAAWGQDEATVGRFAKDEAIAVPGLAAGDRQQIAAYLDAEGGDRWMRWRAGRLAAFYRSIQAGLTADTPGARLYLAGADMLTGPQFKSALRPKLPERLDLQRLMLRVGIDPQRYAVDPDIVLLRPQRLAPLTSLEGQAANFVLRRSEEMDELFGKVELDGIAVSTNEPLRRTTGALFYHEPQSVALPSFARASPFGADQTTSWLLAFASPVGANNRQRFVHSLAVLDSQSMFDGGWMALSGQQESLIGLVDAYRRLPAGRFETVPSKSATVETQPVVVRRLTRGGRTYLYVVNDSPWPVSVTLDLEAGQPFSLHPLGDRELPPPIEQRGGLSWTVPLLPYDLIAATMSAPDVEVSDWRFDVGRQVFVDLREAINDIRMRADSVRNRKPLEVLANPDFELPRQGALLPGWTYANGNGISVDLDRNHDHTAIRDHNDHRGQSLRIRSSGPAAWVRSNPFPAPKTGQLFVWMWLRIDNPAEQPPLQLAVDGRLNGEPYYRPAIVGANDGRTKAPPQPLKAKWWPYLLRVDDVPTSGLTDLRVAVDLMGKGEVWVDDIQVFDLRFDKIQRHELIKKCALADLKLGKGEVIECERILRSYWPEFLRRHVSLEEPRVAANPQADVLRQDTTPPPEALPPPTQDQEEPSPSWIQRIKPKMPKLPSLFR